jgi:hypothetical protein
MPTLNIEATHKATHTYPAEHNPGSVPNACRNSAKDREYYKADERLLKTTETLSEANTPALP